MVGLFGRTRLFQVVCTISVVILVHGQARSAEEVAFETTDLPQAVPANELRLEEPGQEDSNAVPDAVPDDLLTTMPAPARVWTIDYRIKSFCGSQASYEIGTPPALLPLSWAPWSLLRFPLDSTWNGLQVGVERPNWGVHFEWLTPISQHISGCLADYDWLDSSNPTQITDIGYMREHWTDGQTINLDLEYKLGDRFLGLPIEVWPMGGFRWQRFDLMAYDLDQVKNSFGPPGPHPGDIIAFNQQYYICYIGGQLRKTFNLRDEKEIRLTFQGDWGATWGYSIDHHLLGGGFYGLQATQGSSWHVGLTAEVPMNQRLSLGVQADYLRIQTTGKTWEIGQGIPSDAWTNGVCAYSDQTSITAFARLNY